MPQFNHIMPVLKVRAMQATVDFYTKILGFELCWRSSDDKEVEICAMEAGNASLMFSTGSHLGHTPQFSGTLYFDTDDVAGYYEQVKDKVDIVWPLEDMEYGTREFGIHDCDGYCLAFAQVLGQGA
jgi:uncharacterized glyoxalase superfamily protein PhnB